MKDFIKATISEGRFLKIAYLGDSITSTEWVHPNWREIVTYVIKSEIDKLFTDWKLPSWRIRDLNLGFDGATIKDLLKLYPEYTKSQKPDLVIFIASSNDRHDQILPAESISLHQQLISKIEEDGSKVIFGNCTPSYNQEYNNKVIPYNDQLAKIQFKKTSIAIDLFSEMNKEDQEKFYTFESEGNEAEGIKPGEIDYMHPNSLGNAYIAKYILKHGFDIKFDPKKYIEETNKGLMFPSY